MIYLILFNLFWFLLEVLKSLLNPLNFIRLFRTFGVMGLVQRFIFKMQAQQIFEIQKKVFSRLAIEHNAYIVSGSSFLPRVELVYNSKLKKNEYQLTSKGLYSVSLTFNPKGEICHVSYKVFRTPEEVVFIDAGSHSDSKVLETEFGNVANIICADSWEPSSYHNMKDKDVHIITVPSFVASGKYWNAPWGGYTIGVPPDDVDPKDVGLCSEKEAWIKYALRGRMNMGGPTVIAGVNTFMHGKLWDMDLAGETWVAHNGKVHSSEHHENHESVFIQHVCHK